MKKLLLFIIPVLLLAACGKDSGTIVATYQKATPIYQDINEVRQQALLEAPRNIKNPGKIFVSDHFLLIGEEGKGIHLVDNTNPETPTPMHFLNVPFNREFFVKDNVIYAESHYDMLKIDISDLSAPRIMARAENTFLEVLTNAAGEALVGFDFEEVTEEIEVGGKIHNALGNGNYRLYFDYQRNLIPPSAVPASFAGNSNSGVGTVNRIATYHDYVYVLGNSKITVLEDKDNFARINTITPSWGMETIYAEDDRLFVGTQNSMIIFALNDPTNPQETTNFSHANSCDPVYPVGDVAYVTLRTGDFADCPGNINALLVLDISSNERWAIELQEIEMLSPYGMTMINDFLFVGEGANGLKIFDATDRKQLELFHWDEAVEAYDIIPHPSRTDLILVAGPSGLGQYVLADNNLNIVSMLGY